MAFKQKIVERLITALERDHSLTNAALRERFGVHQSTVRKARDLSGIQEPEGLKRDEPVKTPERWPRPCIMIGD